jgi:hypothetical protein
MSILLAAGSPRPTAYESGVRLPSSPPIRMFDVWRGCLRMTVAGATAPGLAARRDAQPCRACLQVRGPGRSRAVADRLNGTMIRRGGEAVFNDG